jgi:hypothetical protein
MKQTTVSPQSAVQWVPKVYSSRVKVTAHIVIALRVETFGTFELSPVRSCLCLLSDCCLCQTAVRLGDPFMKILLGLRLIVSSIFTETRTALSTISFSRNFFPLYPSIAQETRKLKWQWTFQFSEISGISWIAERWFASREWLCSMEFVSKMR